MQPWSVLVLIQVASLRSATTSTRPKKTKQIVKYGSRAKRAFSLNRSKIALFFAWRFIRICYSKLSLFCISNAGVKLNISCGQVARLVFLCYFFKPAKKLQVCLIDFFKVEDNFLLCKLSY